MQDQGILFYFCLHILQMCDTSIFGPTKVGWKKKVNNWKRENDCKEVDEIGFIKILKLMNDRIITKPKIINGFHGTGIFPLNIENVHLKQCIGADDDSKSASKSVVQFNSESFETPTFSNAASSSINIINNELLFVNFYIIYINPFNFNSGCAQTSRTN